MKTYAIVLIVLGSVAAATLFFFCLCNIGRKKKRIGAPQLKNTPQPPSFRDMEIGQNPRSSAMRDGGMVVLGATAAAVAATAATAAVISSADVGGGGGSSCGGGGASGGGCGGGGCGGGCGG